MNFNENDEYSHWKSCVESLDEEKLREECVFKQLDPLFLIDPISQKLLNCTSLDDDIF